jgi:hypothetical protein
VVPVALTYAFLFIGHYHPGYGGAAIMGNDIINDVLLGEIETVTDFHHGCLSPVTLSP